MIKCVDISQSGRSIFREKNEFAIRMFNMPDAVGPFSKNKRIYDPFFDIYAHPKPETACLWGGSQYYQYYWGEGHPPKSEYYGGLPPPPQNALGGGGGAPPPPKNFAII